MELTLKALRNDHAAYLAVEVAEDVVEVGAIGVARDGSRVALKVLGGVDGGAAAVSGRVLRDVLVK
jgi:hypothetical protein